MEGDPLNDHHDVFKKPIFELTKPLRETPDAPESICLRFVDGLPFSINGNEMPLYELIEYIERLGGNHGVGRIVGPEDTIPELGYKEIGVYESPASDIIYKTHKYIESAVFSKTEREMKRSLDQKWGEVVYRGGWYDADRREMSECVASWQRIIAGEVNIELFKGNVLLGEMDIPHSKMIRPNEKGGAY